MQSRKLQEVLRQLDKVKDSLKHEEQMLRTPPQDIEDCCCLSALKCFQANMKVQFNMTEKNQNKLYNSLKHRLTESGLDFCNSGHENSNCQACTSHPQEKASEFFNRLRSLIERAINRLSN
ncbi:interleukin-21 [Symphorus nematophorus]